MLCSNRCVAKLCRSVCGLTRFLISAACAAVWHARVSWRVVMGCTGSRPGNSQPRDRQTFHHSRKSSRRPVRASRCGPCNPCPARPGSTCAAVDVGDLERNDLGYPQASTICDAKRGLVSRPGQPPACALLHPGSVRPATCAARTRTSSAWRDQLDRASHRKRIAAPRPWH